MKAKAQNHLSREELLQRIWIDPARCFGKPCIRGHRIWVSLILDLLASGMTEREILRIILAWNPGTFKPASLTARKCRANAMWTCRSKAHA